eukprot:4206005-Prymnesium_polylepis.1
MPAPPIGESSLPAEALARAKSSSAMLGLAATATTVGSKATHDATMGSADVFQRVRARLSRGNET